MTEGTEYRTWSGKVLSDSEIEAMADEAERGYDVEVLRGRPRRRGRPMIGEAPSEIVPVRLDPALRRAVEARAKDEETTASDIIRQALRRFLDAAASKGAVDDR
jgi:hypothetical protein